MSRLWVPPTVSRELKQQTHEHNQDVLGQLRFNMPVCVEWNRELEKLDPRLKIAKATTDADHPLLRAGFYHLVMLIGDDPLFVNALEGPNGEFVEPSSQMLDMLRFNDLQNSRVRIDRERKRAQAEMEEQREKDRDTEARQEEVVERLKAITRTQVSMNQDSAWAQNARGMTRPTRGGKRP